MHYFELLLVHYFEISSLNSIPILSLSIYGRIVIGYIFPSPEGQALPMNCPPTSSKSGARNKSHVVRAKQTTGRKQHSHSGKRRKEVIDALKEQNKISYQPAPGSKYCRFHLSLSERMEKLLQHVNIRHKNEPLYDRPTFPLLWNKLNSRGQHRLLDL